MALTRKQRLYSAGFISSMGKGPVDDVPEALLEMAFAALARTEEKGGQRDSWGNWDWQYSAAQRAGQIYRPWLDEAIQAWMQKAGIPSRTHWPEGKKFALCLTHDVDVVSGRPSVAEAWYQARATGRREDARRCERFLPFRKPWARRYRFRNHGDVLWHYDRWLKEEERHGFRSSFLMFPEVRCRRHEWDCFYRMTDAVIYDGQRMTVAGMCREIASAGWDVGLHGSYFSFDDPAVLAEQKSQIEAASGAEVVSTRQHFLHYEATRTPAAQSHAGLRVDSTLGFNRSIGFRSGTSFPWYAWDDQTGLPLPLMEVPLHVMDAPLFSPAGLEYHSEDAAVEHVTLLMDAVAAVGGCLTLNWHPNYLINPFLWNIWCRILEEAARRDAWGCSLAEVWRWRMRAMEPPA